MLMRELDLFIDWFLRRHWEVEPSDGELDEWDHLCALLIRWALDQPQVFCHRDFMPRNLMVMEDGLGILDFQDAVLGDPAYDLVSLLCDARRDLPPGLAARMTARFAAATGAQPEPLSAAAALLSAQRNLRIRRSKPRLPLF